MSWLCCLYRTAKLVIKHSGFLCLLMVIFWWFWTFLHDHFTTEMIHVSLKLPKLQLIHAFSNHMFISFGYQYHTMSASEVPVPVPVAAAAVQLPRLQRHPVPRRLSTTAAHVVDPWASASAAAWNMNIWYFDVKPACVLMFVQPWPTLRIRESNLPNHLFNSSSKTSGTIV